MLSSMTFKTCRTLSIVGRCDFVIDLQSFWQFVHICLFLLLFCHLIFVFLLFVDSFVCACITVAVKVSNAQLILLSWFTCNGHFHVVFSFSSFSSISLVILSSVYFHRVYQEFFFVFEIRVYAYNKIQKKYCIIVKAQTQT